MRRNIQDEMDRLNRDVVEKYQSGDYGAALAPARRAAELGRRHLGPESPEYATLLNNLAMLYDTMGNHAGAEPLYWQA
ncbi:MAG: tetratricopeptide repeat protein, partial [Armatimonadetes bacterium]|nr:tetratricopeptide repeat protein [Armatimonadota bacterium]